MPPARLRLGFAGTPDFAVPALRRLAAGGAMHAVFTQPDRPAGRGRKLQASAVKRCAEELGLALYQPSSFKAPEVADLLRGLQLDALIVAAYGLLLPPSVLAIPALGCVNIHASLLPRWRGAAPIQRALLAGDEQTGVTIMQMEAGLDTGPMLARRAIAIEPLDDSHSLQGALAVVGADLIEETLSGLSVGSVPVVPQPAEGATYAAKVNKAEARIRWGGSALLIWRQVRAFNPWPVAETRWGDAQLRIWEAALAVGPSSVDALRASPGTVLRCDARGIDVACGDGVLTLLRLQLAGHKPLSARDFIKSHRIEGVCFVDPWP